MSVTAPVVPRQVEAILNKDEWAPTGDKDVVVGEKKMWSLLVVADREHFKRLAQLYFVDVDEEHRPPAETDELLMKSIGLYASAQPDEFQKALNRRVDEFLKALKEQRPAGAFQILRETLAIDVCVRLAKAYAEKTASVFFIALLYLDSVRRSSYYKHEMPPSTAIEVQDRFVTSAAALHALSGKEDRTVETPIVTVLLTKQQADYFLLAMRRAKVIDLLEGELGEVTRANAYGTPSDGSEEVDPFRRFGSALAAALNDRRPLRSGKDEAARAWAVARAELRTAIKDCAAALGSTSSSTIRMTLARPDASSPDLHQVMDQVRHTFFPPTPNYGLPSSTYFFPCMSWLASRTHLGRISDCIS